MTGATDGVIRLLMTPSIEAIKKSLPFPTLQPFIYYLEDHQGYVNCLHFSSSGTQFITGSWDGTVRLWYFCGAKWESRVFDTYSDEGRAAGEGRKVTMVSFADRDNLVVAATSKPSAIYVFDSVKGNLIRKLDFHLSDIQILSCHPIYDTLLLSASYDGRVAMWDLSTGKQTFSFQANCKFLDGAFSPSGTMFCIGDDLGRIAVFASGICPDNFSSAPECQFMPSDWIEPIFSENGTVIDPLYQVRFTIKISCLKLNHRGPITQFLRNEPFH